MQDASNLSITFSALAGFCVALSAIIGVLITLSTAYLKLFVAKAISDAKDSLTDQIERKYMLREAVLTEVRTLHHRVDTLEHKVDALDKQA